MIEKNVGKSLKIQTAINIVTGIFVLIFNMGVNFFVSPYIVNTLGEEANGFTQLANNFVTYASLITVAFNSMSARFISVSYYKGDIDGVNKFFSSTMICNFAITIMMLPVAILVILKLERIVRIENANVIDVKILFACVFLDFFITLLTSVYGTSMFVKNALYIQNILSMLRSMLNAMALLFVFAFFPPKIFYVSAIALVLSIIFSCLNYLVHGKLLPELKFHSYNFSIKAVKKIVSSGIWNTINQCGNLLMTGLDLIVTNLFISPSSMGVLSVAKTVPTAITSLASTLNSNLAPSLTINWAKGNKVLLLKSLRSGMKISSVIVSIPLMVFCAYGVEFYSLWMPSLDSKQLTILSFLTCMALIPWAGPQALNNIFTATNKLKVNTITFCLSGIINVILVFALLKYTKLGIYAVAGTSSVIQIIRCITVTAPYIAYLMELKWYTFYRDALISTLCCILNYIISRGIGYIFNINSWFSLIIAVIISCIVTFIIDLFVVLNKEERRILKSKVLKK